MQDNMQFEKIVNKRKAQDYNSTKQADKAERKVRKERRQAKREIL